MACVLTVPELSNISPVLIFLPPKMLQPIFVSFGWWCQVNCVKGEMWLAKPHNSRLLPVYGCNLWPVSGFHFRHVSDCNLLPVSGCNLWPFSGCNLWPFLVVTFDKFFPTALKRCLRHQGKTRRKLRMLYRQRASTLTKRFVEICFFFSFQAILKCLW